MSTRNRRRRLISVYKAQKDILRREELELYRTIPIPQWDKSTFLAVARDRGFRTEPALAYELSQKLRCSTSKIGQMLNTGRMSWGEVLCIGSVLEMTPKEFCDCFLNDYFRAYATDVYRASVDNYEQLLQMPRGNAKRVIEDDWHLMSEETPRRGMPCLVTTDDNKVMTATYNIRRGYPPTRLMWVTPHGKIINVKAWKKLEEPCRRKEKREENDD